MNVSAFLDRHQVFSLADFRTEFGATRSSENLLSRAVKAGQVDKVRRGLYVSRKGAYERIPVDPFAIAAAFDPSAAFCLLSALQIHGVSHNVTRLCQFYSSRRSKPFSYRYDEFQPFSIPCVAPLTRTVITAEGNAYTTTTKEQTIIDCLYRFPQAGGMENVLRSIAGFSRVDVGILLRLAGRLPAAARSRIGWVLDLLKDDWEVSEQDLEGLSLTLEEGPYYLFGSGYSAGLHWNNTWRLYLPYTEDEVLQWLS